MIRDSRAGRGQLVPPPTRNPSATVARPSTHVVDDHRPSDMERRVNPFRYLRVTSESGHAPSVAIERLLRRLITLIYAGRDRMVVIRRELPRTKRADPGRRPAA